MWLLLLALTLGLVDAQSAQALDLEPGTYNGLQGSGFLDTTAYWVVGGSSTISKSISHSQSTHFGLLVVGPAWVTFQWKVSSEASYDFLELFLCEGTAEIDCDLIASISGEQDWQVKGIWVPTGLQEVAFQYRKDGSVSTGQDRGWIDDVAVHYWPEAVNDVIPNPRWSVYQMHYTTSGCRVGQAACGRSLNTGIAGSVNAVLTLSGPITLSFWWNIDAGAGTDNFILKIDGVENQRITGASGWQFVSVDITSSGDHTAEWQYSKGGGNVGADAAWLDDVTYSSCSAPNCASCSGSTCLECQPTYALEGGQCVQCPSDKFLVSTTQPCATCNSVDNCAGTVSCTTASDSSCSNCNTNGYYRTAAGKCPPCTAVDHCTSVPQCVDGSSSICDSCSAGYEVATGQRSCQDKNSCTAKPCDQLATCVDHAAPATTYSCTCASGYAGSGAPGDCQDDDFCSHAPSPCDSTASCVDHTAPATGADCTCPATAHGTGTPGGCLSVSMVANSLSVQSPIVDTAGGPAITFQAQGSGATQAWSVVATEIRYDSYDAGAVSPDGRGYPCNPAGSGCSFSQGAPIGTCTCIVPAGVGFDLSFIMDFDVTMGTSTSSGTASFFDLPTPARSASTMWAYPPPSIVDDSVGFFQTNITPDNPLNIASLLSETIGFTGANFLPVAGRCRVYFGSGAAGDSGRPVDEFECILQAEHCTADQLVCRTAEGADGVGKLLLAICGGQSSAPNTNRVNLPTGFPVVDSVTGCQNVPPGTVGCATSGNRLISLHGSGFLGSKHIILIGGHACGQIVIENTNLITCVLPPGTGNEKALILAVDGTLASAGNLISYAQPSISGIVSVCQMTVTGAGDARAFFLEDCPRAGFELTIEGQNFGADLAEVRVGSTICGSLSHSASNPHGQLSCTVSSGNGEAVPIQLSVYQGTSASQQVEMSYQQCPHGTSQGTSASTSCSACTPGRYSAALGLLSCLVCEPGKYATGHSNTRCEPCEEGTAAKNPATDVCEVCAMGRYSDSVGRVECKECPAGRFANDTGAVKCQLCPTGKHQNSSQMSACADCPPGSSSPYEGAVRCTACRPGESNSEWGVDTCEECPIGRHQAQEGTTECVACEPGRFTSATGRQDCQECEAGRFTNQTGRLACDKCGLGQYQASKGAIECSFCKEGQYGESEGRVDCRPCQPGKYNVRQGLTVCDRCAAGHFQLHEQATSCDNCSMGKYAEPGQIECLVCQPGTYSDTNESAVCKLCPGGRFQAFRERTECEPCEAGFESVPGLKACTPCAPFEVAPFGAAQCRTCPPGTVAIEGIQCACNQGTYGRDKDEANITGTSVTCHACPQGTFCNRQGLVVSTMPVQRGWWRASNDSVSLHRCFYNNHCNGGPESTCGLYREGLLCAKCITGYQVDGLGGLCTKCGTVSENVALSIIVLAIVGIGLFLLYYIVVRSERDSVEAAWTHLKQNPSLNVSQLQAMGASQRHSGADITATGSSSRGSTRSSRSNALVSGKAGVSVLDLTSERFLNSDKLIRRRPNFVYKMKIFVGFAQVAMKAVEQGAFSWPRYFRNFMSWFAIFNFDIIPWQSIQCVAKLSYLDKALIVAVMPLFGLIIIFLLFYLPSRFCSKLDMSDSDIRRHKILLTKKMFIKLLLFTVFLVYPHVSALILGVYNCIDIGGVSYLTHDMSILCTSSYWASYAYPMIVFVLMYPIGVVVLYMFRLHRLRGSMDNPLVQLELGFLYMAYTEKRWFFEVVDMAFKLVMTSIVTHLPNHLELGAGLVVSGSYIITLLLLDPYLRKGDFRLHLFAVTELLLLYLVGYTMQESGTDTYGQLMDVLISTLLIGLVLFLFLIFLLLSLKNGLKMFRMFRRAKHNRKLANSAALAGTSDGSFDHSLEGSSRFGSSIAVPESGRKSPPPARSSVPASLRQAPRPPWEQAPPRPAAPPPHSAPPPSRPAPPSSKPWEQQASHAPPQSWEAPQDDLPAPPPGY